MSEPEHLSFSYDAQDDVMTIEGVRYAGDFFRLLGTEPPSDESFKIVSRVDGVLTIKRVEGN